MSREPGPVTPMLRREARQIFGSRVTLVIVLIAPIIAAIIASIAFGAERKVDTTIAVVVPASARTQVERNIAQLGHGEVSARIVSREADARSLVRDGKATAAVVVGAHGKVSIIANRSEQISEGIAVDLARLAETPGSTSATKASTAASIAEIRPVDDTLNGAELYGPVIAIVFLFLTTGLVARSLHAERDLGTMARTRALGVGSRPILISKGIMMVLLGAIEVGAVLLTMKLVFGADWGNPLAVAAVALSIVLVVSSISLVIAVTTKTLEQAQGLEIVIAVTLAALGGHLVPLQNLPDVARVIAGLTPNGLAIGALRDVAIGDRLPGVWFPVALNLALAGALGMFAFARARKIVEA